MKKIKLFLLCFMLLVLFLPVTSKAQTFIPDSIAELNFVINEGDARINIKPVEGAIKVIPFSGGCQAKVEFPAPDELQSVIPEEGSVDFPIYQFHIFDKAILNIRFIAENTSIKIDSSGTCHVDSSFKVLDKENEF